MPAEPFESHDLRRLHYAIVDATKSGEADLARLLQPAGTVGNAAFRGSCRFAHRAILLFPTALDSALVYFAERGLEPAPPLPSVIVRRRLCARYGLDVAGCDVSVTRLRTPLSMIDHNLEVFLFPLTANALNARIIEAERVLGFEDHVAFEVASPNVPTLERFLTILQHDAGLVFEGGGHNPHEGVRGSTVLYFVGEGVETGSRSCPRFQRVELYCKGDFSSIIDRHPVDDRAVERLYANWVELGAPFVSSAA